MNLSILTLNQLKATAAKYALQVDGDKRLRSTWETVNVIARKSLKFTLKAVWSVSLVSIALVMLAADTWHQFKEWLEGQDLTLSQPVAIVRLVAAKIRKRVSRFAVHCYDRFQDWLETQTVRAWYAVDENAIQPAAEFRDRLNAARLVITR